jgi:hypothetical protein
MSNIYKKKPTAWYVLAVVLLLAIALIAYGRRQDGALNAGPLADFATCLKDKGAVFYGTFWCSHCQSQKDMFGSAQKNLPYVECSTADGRSQLPTCASQEISAYPTWTFEDGSRELGSLSLSVLAEKTGCVLSQ